MTSQYKSIRAAFDQPTSSPSPLRQTSKASTSSSAYTTSTNPFPPSRTSTLTSHGSTYQDTARGHKRGLSEAAGLGSTSLGRIPSEQDVDASGAYKNLRQSLRPLPQAPLGSLPTTPEKSSLSTHSRAQSTNSVKMVHFDGPAESSPTLNAHTLIRSDTNRNRHSRPALNPIAVQELEGLQKSSTPQFRMLSRYAEDNNNDLAITSPEQAVTGLNGRRRLQRTMSKKAKTQNSGWAGTIWMDQQRQFLQAYEYLCHIGEAKEWIEDIIHKPIPPIVQLEEALRDGVTLAEIVQALHPERQLRIFQHPKLQFRHSDNIALFFRFLAEVDLPELFRFELVDLYEKKNIPKVIYCIHALSWLLFRKGIVDFRIGNLVGQLQFEDHELEATQKGLDKAGISMPNFSGMGENFGEEPEPEPVESEEDRVDRELAENDQHVQAMQAQIRGALLRMRLGQMMQDIWDWENWLVDLQSRARGDFSRQIFRYKLDRNRTAVNLQSAVRGFLVRAQQASEGQYWEDKTPEVVVLQSLVRARKVRSEVQYLKSRVRKQENGMRQFQAAIRGVLARNDVGEQWEKSRDSEVAMQGFQAAIRGALLRGRVGDQLCMAERTEPKVVGMQSAIRGMLQRKAQRTQQTSLRQTGNFIKLFQAAVRGSGIRQQHVEKEKDLIEARVPWETLQSVVRGNAVRSACRESREHLQAQSETIVSLQANARGTATRNWVVEIKTGLEKEQANIVDLQAAARGSAVRQSVFADLSELQRNAQSVIDLQSACRAFAQREKTFQILSELSQHESTVTAFQGLCRAMLVRGDIGHTLDSLDDAEEPVLGLQAFARAVIVRGQFAEKKRYYKENMEKVVKIQSFIRGRQQGEAYKSLTSGKNPPVGTIKNFVHLLNDSDFDFDEEIEFERLRKTVVQHVRQNEMAEQYIDQLDIKIALLVKNKITLDEVVKHQRHYGGHVGNLLRNSDMASKDPLDLRALNKNSRRKLEQYQMLFFMLQTQPQYLARLFKRIREQTLAEKECKRIEQSIMVLFGFAQKRREEYYLLKLIGQSIKEEVDSCNHLDDYLRANYFWNKLFSGITRSPRDRKFLKDLLGPLIKENIIDADGLDLESDPIQIYRSAINNEELRTGQRSRRPLDLPREEAIKDPETRETFIHHLQDLRDISDQFFAAMEDLLHRMPYSVRFVAQQMFEILHNRFQDEEQEHILQVVGQWVWKTYLQPALTQPEFWGVADRGLSPLQKRNLGEVAKVLGQVAAGRLFGGENVYLQPLNSYVSDAIHRMGEIWMNLIDIRNAEEHFDIDEFNDLYSRTKPTLYIKVADIFSLHNLVVSDLSYVCPAQDDALRDVIRELGSAKNNESELMGVSTTEISLTLTPRLHDLEDPDAAVKALFMETKRYALFIIRVQTGPDLLSIMVRPITADDEDRWVQIVREELAVHNQPHSKKRSAYTSDVSSESSASPLVDITTLTYAQLKEVCLENILLLEKSSRISRHNRYQDLLNAIAIDIRTKHKRRIQRAKELEGVRATLSNLDEKAAWLEGQLKSYNDYIEQAMVTLQNKKGKKRFLLPFTKQYNHEKELERTGRVPKFGSYKYSARTLADKGVLVSWDGYPEPQWHKLDLTISSNQVGVFTIEGSAGSMMIPGASAEVPLDDLLQAQFDNHTFMNLFQTADGAPSERRTVASRGSVGGSGGLRLNVNLFLHLLFKKFYKDSH